MRGRRERRRKQLLDELKETRGYCKLKGEILHLTVWRISLVRGYGSVLRQTRGCIDELPGSPQQHYQLCMCIHVLCIVLAVIGMVTQLTLRFCPKQHVSECIFEF